MSKTIRVTEGSRKFSGKHYLNRRRNFVESQLDREDHTSMVEEGRFATISQSIM